MLVNVIGNYLYACMCMHMRVGTDTLPNLACPPCLIELGPPELKNSGHAFAFVQIK